MKKKRILLLSFILLILFASCAKEEKTDLSAVVTVNGEAVMQQEIDYFKGKFKAELLNDYIEKYNVKYTEDFWQTEFDGKTPEQALYEKALEESIVVKLQFIEMRKEGIYEDITFDGLRTKAELFNAENENKDGVVGIKTIKMSQFYTYYFQNGVMELKNIYAEGKLKPTEKEIEEKIKEMNFQLENSGEAVTPSDYESVAADRLKTEKYDLYFAELRKNAEIKEVSQNGKQSRKSS